MSQIFQKLCVAKAKCLKFVKIKKKSLKKAKNDVFQKNKAQKMHFPVSESLDIKKYIGSSIWISDTCDFQISSNITVGLLLCWTYKKKKKKKKKVKILAKLYHWVVLFSVLILVGVQQSMTS